MDHKNMDTVFEMHLSDEPFYKILNGEKTVEVRLFDEKRQKIQIGDRILFLHGEERIKAKVRSLHRAKSFREFFSDSELLKKSGFTDMTAQEAVEKMRQYYTEEQEKRYGVLGIEITKE